MDDDFTPNQPQPQQQAAPVQPQDDFTPNQPAQQAPAGRQLLAPPAGMNVPKTATLPNDLPEKMGRFAIGALPALGATAATMMFPPAAAGILPAWAMGMGTAAAGGMAGSAAQQGIEAATGMSEAPKNLHNAAIRAMIDGGAQGAFEGLGSATSAALSKIGERFGPTKLYQSALTPPLSKGPYKINRMVQTGLENGVPVSEAGKDAAQGVADKAGAAIDALLQNAPAGHMINPQDMVKPLQDLKLQYSAGTGDPVLLSQITDVESNFLKRHPQPMTPQEAAAAKTGIYKELSVADNAAYNSGGMAAPNALAVQSKQDIAGAILDDLGGIYPEIRGLGSEQGGAFELKGAIDRLVTKEANKKRTPYFVPMAMGGMLGSGAGAAVGGHSAEGGIMGAAGMAAAHLIREAIEDPEIKSKIAIQLYKMGNTAGAQALMKYGPKIASNVIKVGGTEAAEMPSKPHPKTLVSPQEFQNLQAQQGGQ